MSEKDNEYYLEGIGLFYDEKVKFLSKKDNLISCKECPKNKIFSESFEEITLNCGEKNNSKCGIKIKIKFPKYLHYENDMIKLKQELDNKIDFDTIHKYIDVSDKIKQQSIKNNIIEEKIKEITDKFYTMNVENKKKDIQDFYESRIIKTKRCREILKELNKNTIEDESKIILRKEYITLIQNLNKEYIEIQNMVESFQSYYMINKPDVQISLDSDDSQNKEIEKRKEKIGKIVRDFVSCNGLKSKDQLIKLWGEVSKDSGMVILDDFYNHVRKECTKKNIIWREEEDTALARRTLQTYISGYKNFKGNLKQKKCKENKNDIILKKGTRVNWETKGKGLLKGHISMDVKNKNKIINVIDDEDNKHYVPLSKINREEVETDTN